jgi:hypothetical protein
MLTIKQLNPKIAGIRKSTKAMRANIQEVLIHAAANAYVSGDVTAFTKLFDATRGADQKAIAKWAQTYGFAILKAEGVFNVNKSMRRTADFADGDAVVAYLETQPAWFELSASAKDITKELDVNKRLEALLKAARVSSTVVKVDFKAARELMDALHHTLAEVDRKHQNAG